MQRVIPEIYDLLFKLEPAIKDFFYKKIGKNMLPEYKNQVSVSFKQDRITMPKLEEMAELNYQSSTCECSHLIDSLKGRKIFDAVCHAGTMTEVRETMKIEKAGKFEKKLKGVRI